MNDALVSAQQLRTEIRDTAEKEAALIVREANAEADRQIETARDELRRIEAQMADLDRARRTHLTQMRVVAERQLAEIEAAEQHAEAQSGGRPRPSQRVSRGVAVAEEGVASS